MSTECFPCQLVTWEEACGLAKDLAQKVKSSGYRPDLVIAIGRGGYVPARIVCDILLHKDLTSIKIEHWGIAACKQEQARIKFPISVDVASLDLLIIDDVTDTGDTLKAATDYLEKMEPSSIKTGVLQHKATSLFEPDYFVELIREWRWIIYPWAAHEDLIGFTEKILPYEFSTDNQIYADLKRCYFLEVDPRIISGILGDLVEMGRAERCNDMYRKPRKHIG
jgi:hypoxanthine phosphoribosyltransferase